MWCVEEVFVKVEERKEGRKELRMQVKQDVLAMNHCRDYAKISDFEILRLRYYDSYMRKWRMS